MTYYSYWGEFPKVLPKFHVTFDGSMVFDLSKMSDQQLHELGYIKVAPPPDWRSFEIRIDWDGHGWVILDNDTDELHKKYNDDWDGDDQHFGEIESIIQETKAMFQEHGGEEAEDDEENAGIGNLIGM